MTLSATLTLSACARVDQTDELDEIEVIGGERASELTMSGWSRDMGLSEPEAGEEPPQAGEEPPQAGEEPPQAGEEPPQAGEEPPQAGEEPPPVNECAYARVTAELGLYLRQTADTSLDPLLLIPLGTQVEVIGEIEGENINGDTRWLNVVYQAQEGYVSAYFVECLSDQGSAQEGGQTDEEGFYFPFACGFETLVTQGNDGSTSHFGRDRYAFDFGVPTGTPVVAMRAGEVTHTMSATSSGDTCFNGGGSECRDAANYVIVRHSDDTRTIYLHLSRVDVTSGQQVARGEELGRSGNTGYSTGPHLHIGRQTCTNSHRFCDTIPLTFVEEPSLPGHREMIRSGNCP